MRIAIYSDTFIPEVNGVAHVAHMLAQALTEQGNAVCVVTASLQTPAELKRLPGVSYEVFTVPSIPTPFYPGARLAAPVGFSLSRMRAFAPDVIHVHTPFSLGWEAVLCSRALRVPLVGTHHTFFDQYLALWHVDWGWMRRLIWLLTDFFYNRCEVCISPSEVLGRLMVSYGLTAKLQVIPNPVILDRFTPKGAYEAPHPSVVYMGRLSIEKRVEDVLAAFARLPVAGVGGAPQLTLVGDGPYRSALERAAHALGVGDRVRFTGYLAGEALAAEMRSHDVFATASRSENLPVSVIEAMASGLPIVAVAALGLPELVQDGENGFLVPPGDTEAMAMRMNELLADAALRERQGRASRDRALRHAPRAIAELHERAYGAAAASFRSRRTCAASS